MAIRRVMPVVAGATLALAAVSGAARAAEYGGGGDESPACELIGCANGTRLCGSYIAQVDVPIWTGYFPYFYISQPYLISGSCYESPMQ